MVTSPDELDEPQNRRPYRRSNSNTAKQANIVDAISNSHEMNLMAKQAADNSLVKTGTCG